MVLAPYYALPRLRVSGMTAVQQASRDVATGLSHDIGEMPQYRLITRGDELPVFAFTTSDAVTGWDVFAVSRGLREPGWPVPALSGKAHV